MTAGRWTVRVVKAGPIDWGRGDTAPCVNCGREPEVGETVLTDAHAGGDTLCVACAIQQRAWEEGDDG